MGGLVGRISGVIPSMPFRPWYETAFNETYVRAYETYFPHDRSRAEAEAIAKLLKLTTQTDILDLCCGHGRHAIPLALMGHVVTGLDLSEPLLRIAQKEARAVAAPARFVRADVRQVPFEGGFDVVISMLTSFGFFETDEEDAGMLEEVHRILKPNGRLLMEIINRDLAMRRWKRSFVNRNEDGTIVANEKSFDLLGGRINTHLTVLPPDGVTETTDMSYRAYTLTDMVRMLKGAGFGSVDAYGALDGRRLTEANPVNRMVLVASRSLRAGVREL